MVNIWWSVPTSSSYNDEVYIFMICPAITISNPANFTMPRKVFSSASSIKKWETIIRTLHESTVVLPVAKLIACFSALIFRHWRVHPEHDQWLGQCFSDEGLWILRMYEDRFHTSFSSGSPFQKIHTQRFPRFSRLPNSARRVTYLPCPKLTPWSSKFSLYHSSPFLRFLMRPLSQ